jgi:PQQ-like domain
VAILACLSGRSGSVAGAPAPSAAGWTRHDLKPVTQPAPAGGALVLYVARDGGLRIVALEAGTGKTVWSDAASTSGVAPGEPPGLALVGRNVIYLRKVARSVAQIVEADAKSGKERWHSDAGLFTGSPEFCPEDASAICASGSLLSQRKESLELRFDAATGRQLPGPEIASSGGREVGAGLFDPGRRHPEVLVATRKASVAWSRPLAKIFTLRGVSTDWGWNFDRIPRVGLFVGTAGWAPIRRTRRRFVFDLARSMTAGFRIGNGSVAWRSRGTRFVCTYLPCAGGQQAGYDTANMMTKGPRVGLRLVETGTVSFAKSGPPNPVVSHRARVTIQGFSPARGRTIWSFDAGRNVGLMTQLLIPAQVGPNTIVLRDRRGRPVALDLAKGSSRAVPGTAQGWCSKPIQYRQAIGYETGDSPLVHDYVGQFALFRCTASTQHRVPVPSRVQAFLAAIGTRSAGLIAWSDTSGVIARPVRSATR